MKHFFIALLAVTAVSCDPKSDVAGAIEKIPIDVTIVRFDKEFAAATRATLPQLKAKRPLFFPQQYADSVWVTKINDTLQQQLNHEVATAFPDNQQIEDQLLPLFKHIKYYFPQFTTPTVYTTTSDVDHRNKAIVADSLLVLGLDTYLGSGHKFYTNMYTYITKNLNPGQIAPDVATAYARQLIARPKNRTFLAQLTYFGKELYLKDMWLPNTTDAEKIGYTKDEMKWAIANEDQIWRYFVEEELLYSTQADLSKRFIANAPFSKFKLAIDNESPGMIGRYIGWQIVRAYMRKNPIALKELMLKPPEEIFEKSNYKPAKR